MADVMTFCSFQLPANPAGWLHYGASTLFAALLPLFLEQFGDRIQHRGEPISQDKVRTPLLGSVAAMRENVDHRPLKGGSPDSLTSKSF